VRVFKGLLFVVALPICIGLGVRVEMLSRPQADAQAARTLPQFEVASIKPTNTQARVLEGVQVYPGGRIAISGYSLRALIRVAYGVSPWQITALDPWIQKNVPYDIKAKPAENAPCEIKDLRYSNYGIGDNCLREMLQALLIDRFQLKFHRESKTGAIYMLQQSGKPLKLQPTKLPPGPKTSIDSGFASIGWADRWALRNTTMAGLAQFAADNELHATVLDRSGLTGAFDYMQPTDPTDAGKAVREQPDSYANIMTDSFLQFVTEIGLRFERTTGPTETFVVDAARPPIRY
jgi:uncharacterized protein (TIGR03435 family)